jgi:uncharacterized membrane protein
VIAISAGIAASLSLAADPRVVETPWGQVIDAVIGVEIAISLIPPASVVGIGLALGRPDISHNAFALLMINVLGLDVLGSMLMLALRGVRAQYLVLEKAIRSAAESTLTSMPDVTPVGSSINVTLLSQNLARIHATVRNYADGAMPPTLAQRMATDILEKTGCRSEVTVEMIPRQTYSTL